eukprot:CAMPEP_0204527162 /NCGR_PEP_ID=MMETSP0661-20131031/8830_1 /ASSEMBLY_ACC=CAM_ASM_000606 /TAXON_ID=109239 /ORGANISM="Alexandrium margalefi, Strain AMGDE01CS-322" /LENGTH=154 /DNA_ID=CAMNT_0051533047 /DNA_START=108 /DNA_END=572 /DNA_ORIENTATION=-
MADADAISEDAASLGRMYVAIARGRTSAADARRSVMQGNADELAHLAAELAKEPAAPSGPAYAEECPSCAHDYGPACPEGWQEGASGSCAAPAWYAGPCGVSSWLKGVTAAHKLAFEERCAVCWPCRAVPGVAPLSVSDGPIDPASGRVMRRRG